MIAVLSLLDMGAGAEVPTFFGAGRQAHVLETASLVDIEYVDQNVRSDHRETGLAFSGNPDPRFVKRITLRWRQAMQSQLLMIRHHYATWKVFQKPFSYVLPKTSDELRVSYASKPQLNHRGVQAGGSATVVLNVHHLTDD